MRHGDSMTKSKHFIYKYTLLLLGLSVGGYCQAETDTLAEEDSVLGHVESGIRKIATNGRWDVTLTGYAYHSRDTYTDRQIRALNYKAWGGGIGKILRTDSGNDESIYAMVFRDSGRNLQWSAGYAYQWIFPVASTGLEIGAGLTAALISRQDCFNRIPFPALLPVASIGTKDIKLMATYVPHVSFSKGNGKKSKGDLALLFVKFAFD
jgi:hypothetical protein